MALNHLTSRCHTSDDGSRLCRPLAPLCSSVFQAICEVFEAYMVSCFILFSGITLETLVLQVGQDL